MAKTRNVTKLNNKCSGVIIGGEYKAALFAIPWNLKSRFLVMKKKIWIGALVATSLLTVGVGMGTNNKVNADSGDTSLQATLTQKINYVDKDTGKVVGSQNLTLDSNGKSFADDTKLSLPSGYKRTDKFTYDLANTSDQDLHYTKGTDGKTVWNVFVSKNDNSQVSGQAGKTVTATTTTTNEDGSTVTTTTTTTTHGSDSSTRVADPDSSSDSDSTSSNTASSSISETKSAGGLADPNGSSSSTSAKSDTQSSSANSSSTTATGPSNSTGGSSTSGTLPNPNSDGNSSSNNGSSSSSSSSTPSSSSSSASSTAGSGAGAASNQAQPGSTGQNGANQTLPQTSADQAVSTTSVGNILAGLLAGFGLGHLIKRVNEHSK